MATLFINIKQLIQVREPDIKNVSGAAMKELPIIENAFLLVDNDTIVDFGKMEACFSINADETIDATGKIVMPTWCDSHTHVVYAGNRVQEFVDRINGLSYKDIANRGGGILNSAKQLQNTSETDLYDQSKTRVLELMTLGTGAIEIKSGYGLTVEAELKMLRVIKRLKKDLNIKVKATFLGAHAVPEAYKDNKKGYLNEIVSEMLPKIKKENLADYIDVFCEKDYFDLEDTAFILSEGKKYGLKPKIHVNQFNSFGGVALAVKHNALSVDHLEELTNEDIMALKRSNTMPVALPSCSYFLSIPYTPARQLLNAGLPLALASDFNPGSTPSGNMNFVVSTACIKMKLTPEEAINAATINSAYAMEISNTYGSISKGKKANLILTKTIPSYHYLPYSFGENCIERVMILGQFIS